MIITAIPAGFAAGLFGIGGGLITVPILFYIFGSAGLEPTYLMHLAVGTSFIFILLVAISSLIAHYRLGNIDIKTGVVLAVGGILGAQIGPQVLQHVSDQNFKKIFSVLMVITAVWIFVDSKN